MKFDKLKEKILAISELNEKIDFWMYKKLLRKVERAEREYGLERSEIIRAAVRKFSNLRRQEQNKVLSARTESGLLCRSASLATRTESGLLLEGKKDTKAKVSFRCTTPMKDFIDASGDRTEFLNKVVAWYIKLDEQARPHRKKVQPPVIAAVEGIDYIVEKQEEDF